MVQHRTPNPLIKYSYISPEQKDEEELKGEQSVIPAFCTLSSKKTRRAAEIRGQSNTSGKTSIHKIDISQFTNHLDQVPKIKGIKKQELLALYIAKCQDLRINTSKQQMHRFFDSIVKNHQTEGTRKLNLADLALGDSALSVVTKILRNNKKFAQVDLSKNNFSCSGLKQLASVIERHNTTIVHLNIGGNAIQIEGTTHLFRCLQGHPSLTSLDLANNDCYKNKIKIGAKGAEEL